MLFQSRPCKPASAARNLIPLQVRHDSVWTTRWCANSTLPRPSRRYHRPPARWPRLMVTSRSCMLLPSLIGREHLNPAHKLLQRDRVWLIVMDNSLAAFTKHPNSTCSAHCADYCRCGFQLPNLSNWTVADYFVSSICAYKFWRLWWRCRLKYVVTPGS